MKINIGDHVQFTNIKGYSKPVEGIVVEILEKGIPSCKLPMLKIDTVSGYVLRDHCELITTQIHEDRK